MIDSFKHKGKRNQLAELLKNKDILDERVLKAIRKVPRHLFLDSSFEDHAYQNKAFPIGAEQTISHPYTVAFQSQLLDINPGDKVLEIGTGSGYQTAVLLEMGAKVYTIERQKELFDTTKVLLSKLRYKPVYMSFGDGYKGLPTFGPFDKIIVTAGAPFIPNPLLKQLKVNGTLIIPVGIDEQVMTTVFRISETEYDKMEFGSFSFVPMLEDKN
ncbi:MAG: protein-L-isoaspartate(D-aspartate) O-methyltransferase [Flavobacteriales bacterium]|nr:protein-L-isoaspartate(D-aspartate) O-methyltransferase [Flavobacteriales bacterium]